MGEAIHCWRLKSCLGFRKAFQIEMPLQILFENPTIASLAEAIAQPRLKK
ncbi:hypothetical protein FM036_36805 [Nostoc sp. HG1]|nr:hypothetical protein [Nostoc sp. HG1]